MTIRKSFLMTLPLLAILGMVLPARASDHDDGEYDGKGRNLNLTDLYVFRENNFENGGGSANNIVFIMDSNPRSLPQQQYFFSTQAVYDFHVTRVGTDNDAVPAPKDDVILRFKFGAPDSSNIQAITLTTIKDGVATTATPTGAATTTPIGTAPTTNTFTEGATSFSVFAGLRSDPFYFDVLSYFTWRAAVAAHPTGGLAPAIGTVQTDGVNFAFGYNVNAIVVKLPIAFLQTASETVFDTWETISVPQ